MGLAISACFPLGFRQSSWGSQFIQWDRKTFSVSGSNIVLIGGSMHHFRMPSAEWETDFQRMQEDGFNLVDVYLPWFFHEPEEGKVNFESLLSQGLARCNARDR